LYKDWRSYGALPAIDWEGRGYFAYEGHGDRSGRSGAEAFTTDATYETWLRALYSAQGGDFSRVPTLVDLFAGDIDPECMDLCESLLGDAAPSATIDRLAQRLDSGSASFEETLSWCSVLVQRGKIADMRIVAKAYEPVADIKDAAIIPVQLSTCLDPGSALSNPGLFGPVKQYRAAIEQRCDELAKTCETGQALVFKGEPVGVRRLAVHALARLRRPCFPSDFRRRFENATGIDCSSFYEEGRFKPMQAAALITGFLESPQSWRFEDGVRYFFGHRIP
jgi:hypothetical protein